MTINGAIRLGFILVLTTASGCSKVSSDAEQGRRLVQQYRFISKNEDARMLQPATSSAAITLEMATVLSIGAVALFIGVMALLAAALVLDSHRRGRLRRLSD